MSYEGYVQQICSNGHLSMVDAYNDGFACTCGAAIAWSNSVDDTNCDLVGLIPPEEFEKVLIKPAVVETCNLGHQHVTDLAVYRPPVEGELQRYCRDYESGKMVPLNDH